MASEDDSPAAVHVLIATPRPVLFAGWRVLCSKLGWSLLPSVESLGDLPKQAKRHEPNLILVDADWPAELGLFETLFALTELQPKLKIALFDDSLEPTHRMRALLAGCTALLDCKQAAVQLSSDLLQINALPQPQPWGELGRLYQYLVHPVKELPSCAHFSLRECQVLRLLGWGLSNEEIARALHLSIDTTKEHLRRLFKKMAITDRAQAAVWAIRNGLVDFQA